MTCWLTCMLSDAAASRVASWVILLQFVTVQVLCCKEVQLTRSTLRNVLRSFLFDSKINTVSILIELLIVYCFNM